MYPVVFENLKNVNVSSPYWVLKACAQKLLYQLKKYGHLINNHTQMKDPNKINKTPVRICMIG